MSIIINQNHTYLLGKSLHIDSETQDISQQIELEILCSHAYCSFLNNGFLSPVKILWTKKNLLSESSLRQNMHQWIFLETQLVIVVCLIISECLMLYFHEFGNFQLFHSVLLTDYNMNHAHSTCQHVSAKSFHWFILSQSISMIWL